MRRFPFVFMAVLTCAAGSRSALALRIGIVTDGTPAMSQLAAVAQAQLQRPDVQFVEREMLGRILAEQKLSGTVLIDAGQALAIGKLAGADLLAAVESEGQGTGGVVIYDVRNGVRLVDVGWATDAEKGAGSLADALGSAVEKAGRKAEEQKAVCLLTVRNVDLPGGEDRFCQAVGKLLERRLLSSADVVVVERERLAQVRRERELPTAEKMTVELVASVKLLELQVARDGDGYRATCVISGSDGTRQADVPTFGARQRNAAAIAEGLATRVADALKAGILTGPSTLSREAEAGRFLHEGQLRWAHGEFTQALPALEAAAALAPQSAVANGALAHGLVNVGFSQETLGFIGEWNRNAVVMRPNMTQQLLAESMSMVQAGVDQLKQTASHDVKALGDQASGGHVPVTLRLVEEYLHHIGSQEVKYPDQWRRQYTPVLNSTELQDAHRRLFRDYWTLQRILARVVPPSDVRNAEEAAATVNFLAGMLQSNKFYQAGPRAMVIDELDHAVQSIMELDQRYPLKDITVVGRVNEVLTLSEINRSLQGEQFNPLRDEELHRLETIYDALAKTRTWQPLGKIGHEGIERWFFERSHPVPWGKEHRDAVLLAGAPPDPSSTPEAMSARNADAYWKERQLLLDVSGAKRGDIQAFYPALPDGDFIFTVGLRRQNRKAQWQLIRIDPTHPPAGGSKKPAVLDDSPSPDGEGQSINQLASIAGGYYILSDLANGPLTLFPLDGSAPLPLTPAQGFPIPESETATVLNGKVYAGGLREEGLFVEYDIATRASRTLAASRRTEVQSPFDDQPPMRVGWIVPDPARERVVFSAFGKRWPAGLGGVWEYSVKTGKFTQLIKAGAMGDLPGAERRGFASPVYHDTFLFNAEGLIGGIFDLKTDTATRVRAPHDIRLKMDTSRRIIASTEHYSWFLWGRARLDSPEAFDFPSLRNELGVVREPRGVVPLSDDRAIAYDYTTVWLVTPPDDSVKFVRPDPVMAKVTPPPAGGQLPWDKVNVLWDFYNGQTGNRTSRGEPQLWQGKVYFMATGTDGRSSMRDYAQLLKYDPAEGSVTPVTRLAGRYVSGGGEACIDQNAYYFAPFSVAAIQIFPLDGSAAKQIPLPRNAYNMHLAVLNGKLYTGWHYLAPGKADAIASHDPDTGKMTTVLDANGEMQFVRQVFGLWSDPPRNRLLYLLRGKPDETGLWSLEPATGKMTLLLPLYFTGAFENVDAENRNLINWTGTNEDGRLLIANERGLIAFDPATDKAEVVHQWRPALSPLATGPFDRSLMQVDMPANDLMNGAVLVERPFAIHNGYLWYSRGRASLDGVTYEQFPTMRGIDESLPLSGFMFLEGRKQLLLWDGTGAWVAHLK